MNDVLKREYFEKFDKEHKDRVEVIFYKYGPARDNFGSGRVDALETAKRCIDAFERDHNSEHLVDVCPLLEDLGFITSRDCQVCLNNWLNEEVYDNE